MMSSIVLLIGEQPAPNVIPALYLKPARAVLVHTVATAVHAQRTGQFLSHDMECRMCQVDAYDLLQIHKTLHDTLQPQLDSETVFNVTGGTKQMAIAASIIAQQYGCKLAYLQTEGNKSRLLMYRMSGGMLTFLNDRDLPPTLTLQQYLRLYLGDYIQRTPPSQDPFERAVLDALQSDQSFDEIQCNILPRAFGNVEIDFAVRVGTQIGIGEIKQRASRSQGIDQLVAITNQRMLGTYIHRFLITRQPLHRNDATLAKEQRICVITLETSSEDTVPDQERGKLVTMIKEQMSRHP